MNEVNIVPGNKYNMFSLMQRQLKGWKLGGNEKSIWLTKGNKMVTFDIMIHTPKGVVYAMYIGRKESEIGCAGVDKVMIKEKVHDKLGHIGKDPTKEIVEYFNCKIKKQRINRVRALLWERKSRKICQRSPRIRKQSTRET